MVIHPKLRVHFHHGSLCLKFLPTVIAKYLDTMSHEPQSALDQLEQTVEQREEIADVQVSPSTDESPSEVTLVCATDSICRGLIDQLEQDHPVTVEEIAADPADVEADLDSIRGPNIPTCVVLYAIHNNA